MAGKDAINLLRGYPHPSLLPIDLINEATNRLLADRKLAEQSLLYGPDAGWAPLRQGLAKWLGAFYNSASLQCYPDQACCADSNSPIPLERLITTCGASQSLAVILNVLTDPMVTRKIWIVAPAYFLAFRMFEDAGFQGRMRGVPELTSGPDTGVDVAWLRRELGKDEDEYSSLPDGELRERAQAFKASNTFPKLFRHIIYIVPTFANPSSVTTSLSIREELVKCAREFDALILCDDVYDMLGWQELENGSSKSNRNATLPRVVDVDRYFGGGTDRPGSDGYGNVISNGSFSKIVGPGCRLGWAESTPKTAQLLAESGTSKSGDTASVFMSAVVADFIEMKSFDDHLFKTLQAAYASRRRLMMRAIDEKLCPLGIEIPFRGGSTVGGYFIWITLPSPLEAEDVTRRAAETENLTLAKGQMFEVIGDVRGQKFSNNLRLSFAWESEEKLAEGIERLASVIRSMRKASGTV